eukprot:TRINITY_DN38309_c0_g1_i1.p1 TRINITY_DN38309_c0_g1~~TRINITY_DN38309_c0_g1_i1.p1  ORF type:complete len:205 (+),score=20.39 TRINITY_DN38309_c0_g1_i1:27-641(+)
MERSHGDQLSRPQSELNGELLASRHEDLRPKREQQAQRAQAVLDQQEKGPSGIDGLLEQWRAPSRLYRSAYGEGQSVYEDEKPITEALHSIMLDLQVRRHEQETTPRRGDTRLGASGLSMPDARHARSTHLVGPGVRKAVPPACSASEQARRELAALRWDSLTSFQAPPRRVPVVRSGRLSCEAVLRGLSTSTQRQRREAAERE